MSFRKKLKIAAAAGIVLVPILYTTIEHNNTNEKKSITPTVRSQDYAFVATVYQSRSDSNDLVVKLNNEWYQLTSFRNAKNGEGALSPIGRDLISKYGNQLLTKVLEHSYPAGFPHEGKPVYTLVPTNPIQPELLNKNYQVRRAYGTNHNLFGPVFELTDLVENKK